jgi:protein O-GlcNAc transferase
MVARWSTAILRRIGCGDLVAPDAAAYVETAAALAADPARRAGLRATLRGRLAASTTCDPARWMRHVERAFRAVWEADRTPTRAGRALDQACLGTLE